MATYDKRERELILGSPMPKLRYWSSIAWHAARRQAKRRIASLWRRI